MNQNWTGDNRLKTGLLLFVTVCIIIIPLVNAEIAITHQNLSESAGLSFAIKNYTQSITTENDKRFVLDQVSTDVNKLRIPGAIKKYEVVTLNQRQINADLRSISPHLSIQIEGVEYLTDLKRMDFENIDDGIDSYSGMIVGEKNSSVLLTISDNATIGSITLNDETYYIEPVQSTTQAGISNSQLHIIYSSQDVAEQKFLIDNGTVAESLLQTRNSVTNSIQPTVTTVDGRTPVTILVVTDNQFYSDHQGSGWKLVAQDIIAEANRQFGRGDIGVILVPKYDDSRRQDLTNDPQITSDPLGTFINYYPNSVLNANNADLGLYLGGYDFVNSNDFLDGSQGLTWGYGTRQAWAQMVQDFLPIPGGYTGTDKGRRAISIHEIGHLFGADHEDNIKSPFYNRAYDWGEVPFNHQTVEWSSYSETASTYEFSSRFYHGDAMHDNARNISETKSIVAGYAGCSASPPSSVDFTMSPNSAPTQIPISFTVLNPRDYYYYHWDFGDGSDSSETNPDKAYNAWGTYTVRLTVADCAGSSIIEHNIIITPPSQYASFAAIPQSGSSPLTVQFTDSSSPVPTSWNWNFGDGHTNTSQNPQNTYTSNGSFTVNLTVVQNGVASTKIVYNYVNVAPQSPNASFTSFINSGSAPLFIQFNDTSSDYPTDWSWNFGEGTWFNTTDPTQKNASHIFNATGTFTVNLTAINSLGFSTASQQITVTNTSPPTNTSPFEYTVPGSYSYIVPAGINSVNITVVGAGGGGGGGTWDSIHSTSNGGHGGNASQVVNNTVSVAPGNIISGIIGTRGSGGSCFNGQSNGYPGTSGGQTSAGQIIALGGAGGLGGIWSSTTSSYPNGYPGQNGFGIGQFSQNSEAGGLGGIGRGAGGGGGPGQCPFMGGAGANGYVKIQPIIIPPPLASFTATPRTGTASLTVAFTDTSSGSPTSWLWNFGDGNTTNVTEPTIVHTYTANGTYTVGLTATNANGSNATTRAKYICAGDCRDKIGVYQNGSWYLDMDGTGNPTNATFHYFGGPGWTTVMGDWNGDGKTEIGTTDGASWYLDMTGTGNPANATFHYFTMPGGKPVTGDWNGDGKTEIGVTDGASWYLDKIGIGNPATATFYYFTMPGGKPVTGDWNGDGKTEIGVTDGASWYLDKIGTGNPATATFHYFTMTGGKPVTGDWNGDGKTEIGVTDGASWYLDTIGTGNPATATFHYFTMPGGKPVTGDWNGDGKTEIGVTDGASWYLDTIGTGNPATATFYYFGGSAWTPVIGKWS